MKDYPEFVYSKEVYNALKHHKPVVALESTIISFGMPYPKNVECALSLEQIIRDNGATPATLAIINGQIKIGLDKEDIELLAQTKEVIKVSKRDVAYACAKGLNGALTVSGTAFIADLVGIEVFATGGLGGVHRGNSLDVSNDLEEIRETNVVIVSAGIKSILDIPRTLEYLETNGILCLGYKTNEMPAFYTYKSGLKLEYSVDSPTEIAYIHSNQEYLGLRQSILVFNPIAPEFAQDKEKIDQVISKALKEAEEKGITGKETTPFLLETIKNMTQGESLETNIKLIQSNAALAAQIAKELHEKR